MINFLKRNFWKYILEIVIAVFLVNISLGALLVYAYIMLVLKIDIASEYSRKLTRVFQVSNEVKLLAIISKLDIKDTEIRNIMKKTKEKLTEDQWRTLEKDFQDIA